MIKSFPLSSFSKDLGFPLVFLMFERLFVIPKSPPTALYPGIFTGVYDDPVDEKERINF
jgi:hypothetical protein